MVARLKELYFEKIRPALKKKFSLDNDLAVGRIEKVCLNSCVGLAVRTGDKKLLEMVEHDLTLIAGQKAVQVNAKRSVSNFKLRKGFPLAVRVTLRGDMCYEFLDRLLNIALPRTRDFRGLSPTSFDGRGNYSMGVPEHSIFPEIDPDKSGFSFGMDINIATTCFSDEMARELLTMLGMPFRQMQRMTA